MHLFGRDVEVELEVATALRFARVGIKDIQLRKGVLRAFDGKLIELEQQGGDLFFGEKSFEVDDLMRLDEEGKAFVNIIRFVVGDNFGN